MIFVIILHIGKVILMIQNKITDIQVLDTKYSYIKTIWVKEEDGLKN